MAENNFEPLPLLPPPPKCSDDRHYTQLNLCAEYRTLVLVRARQALYQLSYIPKIMTPGISAKSWMSYNEASPVVEHSDL